jgi:hypothetical protein
LKNESSPKGSPPGPGNKLAKLARTLASWPAIEGEVRSEN